MGGVCLMALWLCMMSLEGWKAFGKEDLVVLAPFAAYLLVVIASFARAPYPGPSVDDFVRYLFYMSVAIMVIREFDSHAVSRLTKVLTAATWITVGYGMLQWIDVYVFQPPAPGIDPFIWRGAFIKRVFSTFGNPNFFADYLVLVFPILVTQFLKTRAWNLIVLIAMTLWCLFFTETKGAWIGFAVSTALFTVAYAYFFSGGDRKAVLRRIGGITLVIVVAFGGLVGYYVMRRKSSVSFRVLTWLSTWEMIETQPLLGTGVGSFKVVYPAFRRPGIFHIEGKHNTETDHAENEYLEQWFDHGIIGFGVFIWLLVSTIWVGLNALSQLTESLKGSRPPPRAYDLLGYLMAFVGMMAHNSFDVSLRFVSSGVFLGLLPGVIVNLSRGYPLGWLQQKRLSSQALTSPPSDVPQAESPAGAVLRLVLAAAVTAAWGWTVLKYGREFDELQGPFGHITAGGEALQWWISWGCFAFLSVGFAVTFARASFLSRKWLVPVLALLVLAPLDLFWGYFKADIHHNLAIFYSKERQWDKAIENYIEVNRLNPYFVMPYYFEGNVFSDRFDLNKTYRPLEGDPKDTPRDDYERASEAYAKVRAQAPNYVQMHHQMGSLYQKMGDEMAKQGKQQEAQAWYDRALARYDMYHELDPVFPLNYYREAQIYIGRKDYDKAIAAYREYIEAPRCHGHPGLDANNPGAGGVPFAAGKGHEDPEAYTNLGNAYFMKGDLAQARASYLKALEIDPHFESARRNLSIVETQKRS
jgi:O-antigen ligase/tetratricopeptide (TPR) repeat protein